METMKVTWKAGNCFSLCSWARTARKVDTRLSRWGGCHFHHHHSDLIIFVVTTMFFVGRIRWGGCDRDDHDMNMTTAIFGEKNTDNDFVLVLPALR